MNSTLTLETERLLLRQFADSDDIYFVDFFSDARMAKYVGGVQTPEEAWRLMASYIGHWQLKGFGYFAVQEKETSDFVGCSGLWKSPSWPELELGYWFMNNKQKKGYATESALRVKQYAFKDLHVPTLVSYIDPENLNSKRVSERIGGVYDKTIDLLNFGPHEVFRYQD